MDSAAEGVAPQYLATGDVIVLGAGPVGLAMALLLQQQGRGVQVFEAKPQISTSDANSYPIGVNPRGQATLAAIDQALLGSLRSSAEVIKGWRIYAGKRLVAQLDSGTVWSTTRATVTRILLERALATPGIEIHTGHKLVGVEVAHKRLSFELDGGEISVVDAGNHRVIAADGVWSRARRAVAEQVESFIPQVDEWGVQFRVIFSEPGASTPGMDPACHYIFGSKGVYAATLKDEIWCVVASAVEGSAEQSLLTAQDASPENVQRLRDFVDQNATPAEPLLTEKNYTDYFTRDTFAGAVVRCSQLSVDEWLVFIGDAAHAVAPPTGEGINSGLEDARLLAEHLASGSATPFADFNTARLPDVLALGDYAYHLVENVRSTDPAQKAANIALRIINTVAKPFGNDASQVEDRLFGPDSNSAPYRDILSGWLQQRETLFPRIHRIAQFVTRAGERLSPRHR